MKFPDLDSSTIFQNLKPFFWYKVSEKRHFYRYFFIFLLFSFIFKLIYFSALLPFVFFNIE